MSKTVEQYNEQIERCRQLFVKKNKDYGTAWRVLRPSSITDQLFIKARRIRTIEEKGEQRVADGIHSEYIGLVNYGLMALIQLELEAQHNTHWELPTEEALQRYDQQVTLTRQLMLDKNHDYGEVWREMRCSSFTDLIIMKLLRVKQIEDLQGKTLVSEGIDANYRDIVNYAIFALIQLAH